jgi:hypothetical protein
MAKLARIALLGVPHRVTERGSRRQPLFFEANYAPNVELASAARKAHVVRCGASPVARSIMSTLSLPYRRQRSVGGLVEARAPFGGVGT